MDISSLTILLLPYLSSLVHLGGKATEKIAEKVGEEVWEKAKKIWNKLSPFVEERPDLQDAVRKVIFSPESKARQALLQEELEILFREVGSLSKEVEAILNDEEEQGETKIQQNIQSNQGQVIGIMSGGNAIAVVQGNVRIN